MMDPVNNNFLSYNFFWLWHYAASWKAELISGLYHGLSVWCEIKSYRSMLLILDAWLHSLEIIWADCSSSAGCGWGWMRVLGLSAKLVALLAGSWLSGAEQCPSALEVGSWVIWPVTEQISWAKSPSPKVWGSPQPGGQASRGERLVWLEVEASGVNACCQLEKGWERASFTAARCGQVS